MSYINYYECEKCHYGTFDPFRPEGRTLCKFCFLEEYTASSFCKTCKKLLAFGVIKDYCCQSCHKEFGKNAKIDIPHWTDNIVVLPS